MLILNDTMRMVAVMGVFLSILALAFAGLMLVFTGVTHGPMFLAAILGALACLTGCLVIIRLSD